MTRLETAFALWHGLLVLGCNAIFILLDSIDDNLFMNTFSININNLMGPLQG